MWKQINKKITYAIILDFYNASKGGAQIPILDLGLVHWYIKHEKVRLGNKRLEYYKLSA